MKKYKKKPEETKYKFNKGTQRVDVPPTMTGADVGAQALSGAAAGAAMGSVAGPWGTVIGGAVGGVAGAAKGMIAKDAAQAANTKALSINAQAERNMRVGTDSKLQNYQFKNGSSKLSTKTIEIEAKGTPEIHTDKDYNIKTFGKKPHTEGGTKTIATEGDIVFDTQNSKEDYKTVLKDISLYKMKGDKNAYKRLEKRRKEMPSDTEDKKAYGDPYVDPEVDLALAPNKYVANPLDNPYIENYRNAEVLGYQNNQLTVPEGQVAPFNVHDYTGTKPGEQFNFTQSDIEGYVKPNQVQTNPLFSNENLGLTPPVQQNNPLVGTGTLGIPEGGGRSMPSDKPTSTGTKFNKDNLSQVGRYANIGYNAIQSFNKPQKTLDRDLQLNRYKYSDMSDPLRQAARQSRATQVYNASRAGTSIGQQQSYGQQAQNAYVDQLGEINARENQAKQTIQNANVDVSNTENQVNYERAYQNNDIAARRRAAQQAYGAAAASEAASLAEVQQQERLQREAQNNVKERDKQYLETFRDRNFYFGNPDEVGFLPQYQRTYPTNEEPAKQAKGNSNIKVKSKYVYKSGTKSKKK